MRIAAYITSWPGFAGCAYILTLPDGELVTLQEQNEQNPSNEDGIFQKARNVLEGRGLRLELDPEIRWSGTL